MEIKILLLIIVSLIVLWATVLLVREYVTMQNKLSDMDARLKKLEEANKKRMPYEAMEAILDGMAALDVREREVEFEESILKNAKAHFAKALAVGTKREEK